ncbi:Acyl-CoA N-acyltransferase [Pleurotus pulmonarius]
MSSENMDEKKQTTPRATPQISEIESRDIPTAVESWRLAFENDPLRRYMLDGKKPSRSWQFVEDLYMQWFLTVWRRRKIILTVEHGQSYVIATTPEIREPTTIIDRILDWTIVAMTWTWGLLRSAELRKRRKEVLQKITSATERVYGDRVKSMVHIDGLATSPQSQGRGYAGALLDAVTAKADAGSRATYLESSNVANTGFYESHGFRTIEEIQCGDDNPAWKEPPVVVKLMVREHNES